MLTVCKILQAVIAFFLLKTFCEVKKVTEALLWLFIFTTANVYLAVTKIKSNLQNYCSSINIYIGQSKIFC